MSIITKITDITQPIVESKGGFIVDVGVHGTANGKDVELFVDNDTGITTDLCSEISREVSQALDASDVITHRYHLVVSSPGIDRPLKLARQYPKNVGREIIVKYEGENQVVKIRGTLQSANPEGIEIKLDDNTVRKISFNDIIETKVCAAW